MRSRLHYAWVVFAVTFVILLVGAGVRAAPSVLIVPLQTEFGWSSAQISAAIALNIFLYGVLGPFAVAIFERFGLVRTVASALVLLAVGVGATTLMTRPWHMMLLWGVLVGTGTGVVGLVIGATVANRWFVRHRGIVVGALTASTATGQLIFLPLLAWLATEHGWRWASAAVAGATLALILPTLLLLKGFPIEKGLPRYGEVELTPAPPGAQNPMVRALSALRTGLASRDFWLLSGSFFICGASTNGLIGTHLISACFDHGIPEVRAAGLLALMGVLDLVGTTLSGWLTDRYDSRILLATYYGLRGLSLMFLPYAFDFSFYGLSLFAIFYGLDWIATVPPTVRLSGQAFGEGNAALMYGWIAAAHQVGAASAAWGAGLVRTGTGDYLGAFLAAGLLCLGASMMVLFIGRGAPDRARTEPAGASA
jgi:sugar phosphate permease